MNGHIYEFHSQTEMLHLLEEPSPGWFDWSCTVWNKKEEVELPFLASNEAINRKTQASVNLNMTQVSVERNNQWLVVNHQATHSEPANIFFYLSDSEKAGKI